MLIVTFVLVLCPNTLYFSCSFVFIESHVASWQQNVKNVQLMLSWKCFQDLVLRKPDPSFQMFFKPCKILISKESYFFLIPHAQFTAAICFV